MNEAARKGIVKDKGLHAQELALFTRLQETLAADRPLRDLELSPIDEKLLASYQLLTRRPMLVVYNVGDDKPDLAALPPYEHAHSAVVALQGKLRLEGKEYVVQDADILNIRFSPPAK